MSSIHYNAIHKKQQKKNDQAPVTVFGDVVMYTSLVKNEDTPFVHVFAFMLSHVCEAETWTGGGIDRVFEECRCCVGISRVVRSCEREIW